MMIGARTAAWAKSGGGVPTARDYVQDGLIAMWDGIENAGWGVHDPNATVWKDLVGSRDLIGVDGMFRFDDSSFISELGGISATSDWLIQDVEIGTIEIVVEPISFDNSVTNKLVINFSNTNNGLFRRGLLFTDNFAIMRSGESGSWNKPKSNNFAIGDRRLLTGVFSSATNQSQLLDNGVVMQNTDGAGHGITDYGFCYIDGRRVSAKIKSIRLYSTKFEQPEILANYAVDKARFNLTDAT